MNVLRYIAPMNAPDPTYFDDDERDVPTVAPDAYERALRRALQRTESLLALKRAAVRAATTPQGQFDSLLREAYTQGLADMLVATKRFVAGEQGALAAALDRSAHKDFGAELLLSSPDTAN